MHCHPDGDTHPPPLVSPFLLAQNLSSKLDCTIDISLQNKLVVLTRLRVHACKQAEETVVMLGMEQRQLSRQLPSSS